MKTYLILRTMPATHWAKFPWGNLHEVHLQDPSEAVLKTLRHHFDGLVVVRAAELSMAQWKALAGGPAKVTVQQLQVAPPVAIQKLTAKNAVPEVVDALWAQDHRPTTFDNPMWSWKLDAEGRLQVTVGAQATPMDVRRRLTQRVHLLELRMAATPAALEHLTQMTGGADVLRWGSAGLHDDQRDALEALLDSMAATEVDLGGNHLTDYGLKQLNEGPWTLRGGQVAPLRGPRTLVDVGRWQPTPSEFIQLVHELQKQLPATLRTTLPWAPPVAPHFSQASSWSDYLTGVHLSWLYEDTPSLPTVTPELAQAWTGLERDHFGPEFDSSVFWEFVGRSRILHPDVNVLVTGWVDLLAEDSTPESRAVWFNKAQALIETFN
jgi:hypothetical protein